jgi:hypothetical protein
VKFFVGLHQVCDVRHFDRACISINRFRKRVGDHLQLRKKHLPVREGCEIILDSAAFTELSIYGAYRHSVFHYAQQLRRFLPLMSGACVTVVSQDWMCEAFILKKTGLTVADHQRLTIERYDALLSENVGAPILAVLQGYDPRDYRNHVRAYGDRLEPGAWVGLGSVCKRNSRPDDIAHILSEIHGIRPDLRCHGFGVKTTALSNPTIRRLLYSADSMAWSHRERRARTGQQNDWRVAESFRRQVEDISARPVQMWQPSFSF